MLTRSTNISFLVKLKDGVDPAAWFEFERRYGDLIRNVAMRRGLQPADCDDVVQEVMLALTRSMPGFEYDPSRGRFRGYLKTIAGNVLFRKIRQNEARTVLSPHDEAVDLNHDSALESVWEAEWRQYHMRVAMRTIESEFGELDRLAFSQYAVEGDDARETARALGLSVDQVYQAKSRILRRLSELIEKQVREEG